MPFEENTLVNPLAADMGMYLQGSHRVRFYACFLIQTGQWPALNDEVAA